MRSETFAVILGLLLVPALALADPKTPEEFYAEGQNQYNVQNWDKAIDAFKKGYELEIDEFKKAAYLFNVAQSYRQRAGAGDCTKAQFYYKRYLAIKDSDTKKPLTAEKRQAVDDQIASLEACVAEEAKAQKPVVPTPDPNKKDPVKPKEVGTKPDPNHHDDDDDDKGIHKGIPTDQPKLLTARLLGGGSKVTAGSIKVPIQATFGLVAGYPIAINDKLAIDVGAAFDLTPVPYEKGSASATGTLTTALANAGLTYQLIPKLSARVDIGVGALLFGNISSSVFTMERPTTGTLGMFAARGAVSADYAVTPNVLVSVTPASFSFSPAKSGLREDIKSITLFEFMVGVGYRM